MGLSVDKPVGLSVVPRLAVEIVVEVAVEIAMELPVEIAVEIAMASAMGLHGVPRHSVEARGRSAVARGVSAVVRGTLWKQPWNAVEVREHCRGAPPKR